MPNRPASSAQRPLALVTGASAGLGAAFARAYAAKGHDLALVARRAGRLEALARELKDAHGTQSLVIPADLSELDAHIPVLDAIEAEGRHVDVLVNNAGFGIPQSFTTVPWSRQREFLMTLVVTVCGFAHGVIPGMASRGRGSIINIASLAAFSPGVAGNSLYPGAKSLVLKFSQALDAEYRERGIKVTAVCPGFTRTEFGEKAGVQEIMDQAPRMFSQTAEEVARVTIAANEAGRLVFVPGLHNKIAALLMRRLPQGLVRAAIAAGSAKYHLEE
ncbi:SDR family NAD(P)-dependent oxidoreductase [Phenylobacterium montanum]|uniref:SDR family NAD(P)-dependent oxidoreductase n=1 Tax=Phenylobacterium montanum TaxID=2823693 RepID=A0A975FXQ9_9CAUL|nr:SDR family NAD(P)-dependent oxidoreductase [Caulobacter sp. S6]QUD86904.1 SDR family NAD(P)-dependent oxidoreductase [Caulobacter sp. S6]